MLARERSDHGVSGESRGGHARGGRLPQAGLRGAHRGWDARHSLSGRELLPPERGRPVLHHSNALSLRLAAGPDEEELAAVGGGRVVRTGGERRERGNGEELRRSSNLEGTERLDGHSHQVSDTLALVQS